MNLNEIVKAAHDNAVKHGFWEPAPELGTSIALIHSELSEALEEARTGKPLLYFRCTLADDPGCERKCEFEPEDRKPDKCYCNELRKILQKEYLKPEGVASELADAVIRIADLCGHLGIDLEAAVKAKMAFNETREYKHGKKF